MNSFRGFLSDFQRSTSNEPYFNGSEFSVKERPVPTSFDYKVDDLIAVGKVSPVSTEILHDSDAVEELVSSPVNVQPSND